MFERCVSENNTFPLKTWTLKFPKSLALESCDFRVSPLSAIRLVPCAVFESPVRRELDEIAIQKIAEREKQVEDGALGHWALATPLMEETLHPLI